MRHWAVTHSKKISTFDVRLSASPFAAGVHMERDNTRAVPKTHALPPLRTPDESLSTQIRTQHCTPAIVNDYRLHEHMTNTITRTQATHHPYSRPFPWRPIQS